jgi:hypothetical protein
MSADLNARTGAGDVPLDHRLSNIGWGLLFVFTLRNR